MTAAYETPNFTVGQPIAPVSSPAATVPGTVTGSLILAGFLTVVVAAWGGIVPYVGPVFGFGATGTGSWAWDMAHGLLGLVPGALGVVAGLSVMFAARRNALGLGRPGLALAGLAAVVSGAWFVVGPTAWPVIDHGLAYFAGASPSRQLLDTIGYAFGPGVILAACGGFTLAKALRHRVASTPLVAPAGMPAGGPSRSTHLRRVPEPPTGQPMPPAGQPMPAPDQPMPAPIPADPPR